MKIRPEEITSILEKEIQSFDITVDIKETGTIK